MKRATLSLLLCGLIASIGSAQSLIPINTEVVKRAVVFLYGADATGKADASKELATGFLVEIPLKSDATKSYMALVTARHVVDPVWACTAAQNPTVIYARVNRKPSATPQNSDIEFIRLPLVESSNKPVWAKNASDAVDAAVVPIDGTTFLANDVAAIKVAEFGTPEEIKTVGIGSDIVSAGLVPGLFRPEKE